MTPDPEESIRCTLSCCSCVCFRPGSVQLRSCDCCGHGWVAHALEKLQAQPPSSCGPVEVALPGVVFDLSSLVLYGAQAIPVCLKILLDRLYSILTPEQVGHILHTLGWNLGDYVRGYMLQFPSGKVLDRWFMVTPEEEVLILKQFLRFGETRPIVELMLQTADGAEILSDPELKPTHSSCQSSTKEGTMMMLRSSRGDSRLELIPPSKLTQFLRKSHCSKLVEKHKPEGGRTDQETDPILPQCIGELAVKVKADPDKPSPPRSLWYPSFHSEQDYDLQRGTAKHERGRKGRVCCGVCGKSFYDKGTLKIHYNAVHLKIKHRCTVAGCTMVFSSLRSRNRHSANPNPRLHTSSSRDTYRSSDHTSVHTDTQIHGSKQARKSTQDSHITTPISQESCDTPRASHYCEGNRWQPESIDPVPKKKPRKSSMPVKIEREMVERRRHENEEEY
nr:PREDICTED: zinc finger protein basonuclin-2-like [Pundamilia nyererei]